MCILDFRGGGEAYKRVVWHLPETAEGWTRTTEGTCGAAKCASEKAVWSSSTGPDQGAGGP